MAQKRKVWTSRTIEDQGTFQKNNFNNKNPRTDLVSVEFREVPC